jgi:hypothetical protein
MFPLTLVNSDKPFLEDRLYTDVANNQSGNIGDAVKNDFKYMQYGLSLVFGVNSDD